MNTESPLMRYLRDRQVAVDSYSPGDWSLLVREAQRNKLLSRVACLVQADDMMHLPPGNIRLKLESAVRIAAGSERSVRWEVRKIQAALQPAKIPVMLLKGAAYQMAGLQAASGRLYVDVDIMVPRDMLERAERVLFDHGWFCSKMDAYDQKYYRTWMHEIPPMRHTSRNTSLDVHHTILPPTASLNPSVDLLWQQARELPDLSGVYVLAPIDMVLHSAVHLFHDGDLDGGLRDLVDLDAMLGEFGEGASFWDDLLQRARDQDLVKPLYYALKYSRLLLGTTVPPALLAKAEVLAALPPLAQTAMDPLVAAAVDPTRENLDSLSAAFCRWLLYVRSHYLRMPLHLLLPHLARKALKSEP